jgi:uridine kinase
MPAEAVLAQYRTMVRPMYRQFVEPSRRHADLAVRGDADAQAVAELLLVRAAHGAVR